MKKPKTEILTRHESQFSNRTRCIFSLVSVAGKVIVDNPKSILKEGELLVSEPVKLSMKALKASRLVGIQIIEHQ